MLRYILNLLTSLDQVGSAAFGGSPAETISGRAGKYVLGSSGWAARLIDALFFLAKNHNADEIELGEGVKPMLSAVAARKEARHHTAFTSLDWPAPHFPPKEIACKGTGLLYADPAFLSMLEALRSELGNKPVVVGSGSAYRTPEHNEALRKRGVKAAKHSYHMRGIACDVSMANHDPNQFEAAARKVGFTGFGFYPERGFMHIDIGPAREWGTRWPADVEMFNAGPEIPPSPKEEQTKGAAKGGAGALGGVGVLAYLERFFSGESLGFSFPSFSLEGLEQLTPLLVLGGAALVASFAYWFLWRTPADQTDEPFPDIPLMHNEAATAKMQKERLRVVLRVDEDTGGNKVVGLYAPDGVRVEIER